MSVISQPRTQRGGQTAQHRNIIITVMRQKMFHGNLDDSQIMHLSVILQVVNDAWQPGHTRRTGALIYYTDTTERQWDG